MKKPNLLQSRGGKPRAYRQAAGLPRDYSMTAGLPVSGEPGFFDLVNHRIRFNWRMMTVRKNNLLYLNREPLFQPGREIAKPRFSIAFRLRNSKWNWLRWSFLFFYSSSIQVMLKPILEIRSLKYFASATALTMTTPGTVGALREGTARDAS